MLQNSNILNYSYGHKMFPFKNHCFSKQSYLLVENIFWKNETTEIQPKSCLKELSFEI